MVLWSLRWIGVFTIFSHQIQGAERAKELYSKIAFPSMKDFKWTIQSNSIQDCPVTHTDVKLAEQIWWPNITALKGKTTWSSPKPVAVDCLQVPKEILDLHKTSTSLLIFSLSTNCPSYWHTAIISALQPSPAWQTRRFPLWSMPTKKFTCSISPVASTLQHWLWVENLPQCRALFQPSLKVLESTSPVLVNMSLKLNGLFGSARNV